MSNKIVYRINGGTTVVQASAIKDAEDLAYGMGFLANHRLYKMSKDGGVTKENALEVASAFMEAANRFAEEVLERLDPSEMEDTISNLGLGQVDNPFHSVTDSSR